MLCFDPNGYRMACDKCGRDLSYGGRTIFKSPYAVVETARSLGWNAPKSSPYKDCCPNCQNHKGKE